MTQIFEKVHTGHSYRSSSSVTVIGQSYESRKENVVLFIPHKLKDEIVKSVVAKWRKTRLDWKLQTTNTSGSGGVTSSEGFAGGFRFTATVSK